MRVFCILLLFFTATTAAQAAPDWQRQRSHMVDVIRSFTRVAVTDEAVLTAMNKVPRHLFVPESQQSRAYRDSPLSIGFGQTISQPYIVALMTQLVEIDKNSKVLEIGTGSGYQAAILAELSDHVYSIEIIPKLAERTKAVFERQSLPVHLFTGDGYYGLKEHSPFDRIIVTAAAAHIPSTLLAQLKAGGKMIIPVGPRWGAQYLLIVSKDMNGQVSTKTILPVRFVPLVGGDK